MTILDLTIYEQDIMIVRTGLSLRKLVFQEAFSMDNYKELDRVWSNPYLGDAFYDADVEYVMDILLPSLKQEEWCALGACLEEKLSRFL